MCLADLGPVVSVDPTAGVAVVDLAGVQRRVSLAPLVLDGRGVAVGDWVVVHTGLAVELMDERDALAVVAERQALGEVPAGPAAVAARGGLDDPEEDPR